MIVSKSLVPITFAETFSSITANMRRPILILYVSLAAFST